MIRDRIAYDVLVQNALRGVVRQVLADVAKSGLPGEHHFFITFSTHMADVSVSARLKERYPDQMTIVLQHQFWDLKVEDDYFSVTLSFGDVAEKLVVPFAAVQAFYDPAAAFEAAFDMSARNGSETDGVDSASPSEVTPLPAGDEVGGKVTLLNKDGAALIEKKPTPVTDVGPWRKQEQNKATNKERGDKQMGEQENPDNQGGAVISLDAFRKK